MTFIQDSKRNEWLQVDLGERRTIFQVAFRGGHYQGKSCLPGELQIERILMIFEIVSEAVDRQSSS